MTHSNLRIPGINDRAAAKLSLHGIHDRRQLVEACGDAGRRTELERLTGLSAAELCRFAGRAELLTINGVQEFHLGMLIDAGVTSMRDLAHANAVRLHRCLSGDPAQRSPVTTPPVRHLVGWIAQARAQLRARAH